MLFAAEEAKAQTACDGKATFDVFVPHGEIQGTWQDSLAAFGSYTLTGSLTEVYNSWSGTTFLQGQFSLFSESGSEISRVDATPDGSSPPIFGGNAPMAGQLIRFLDGSASSGNDLTLRIYTRSDNELALTQRTATAADTCDTGLAGMTGMPFFLTADYAETTTAATTNIGYAAPNCGANMVDDGTGLGCQAPMDDGDCKMLNQDFVFNMDTSMCELSAEFCLAMDEPQVQDGSGGCRSCDDSETTVNGMDCEVRLSDAICLAMDEPQIYDSPTNDCIACDDGETTTDGIRCGDSGGDETDNVATPAAAEESDEGFPTEDALIAYGGVFGVVLAAHFLWDGNPNAFAFSPDVGYSLTESGYSFNAGGRMDFHKDRWHLYWTAGQQSVNGDTGDFRYSSGGSYAADFWTATFSENASGEIVDYDFSLSANYGNGVWKLSPVYRLHSRFEESETGRMESETTNSLNLEGVLLWNRWAIKPSAGFQWRGMDDFADNAKFGFSAVRNL